MELVFATNNLNKLKEVRELLPESINLLSLRDIGCFEDIEETADKLEGNARIKSDYIKEKYGYDCFADDTGLEVEALKGAPGVYSARYAGESATYLDNVMKLLDELHGVENRRANFRTVISLNLNQKQYFFEGICEGEITRQSHGGRGFGYDPIFRPKGHDKTFAEMEMQEKGTMSHRGLAVQKLVEFLNGQI